MAAKEKGAPNGAPSIRRWRCCASARDMLGEDGEARLVHFGEAAFDLDRLGRRTLRSVDGQRAVAKRRHEGRVARSEEHTSELQSLMRISYAVFCLKKKTIKQNITRETV